MHDFVLKEHPNGIEISYILKPLGGLMHKLPSNFSAFYWRDAKWMADIEIRFTNKPDGLKEAKALKN